MLRIAKPTSLRRTKQRPLNEWLRLTSGEWLKGQLNAYWDLVRADQRSRSKLSYDGSFGYANTEQTVNRHLGTIEVKLFLSRRFFFIPATSEFLNDRFQNYKFRATPAAGAGVHIFDTKKVEWDAGSALGYQYARFFSAAAAVENPQNDGFIGFRTYADFEFTDDVELELEWRTNLVYTEIGLTNHLGSARFSVEVTDILDLETTFKFYRTENPLRGPTAASPRRTTTSSSSAWRSRSARHGSSPEKESPARNESCQYPQMALHKNRFVRSWVNLFLKLALTRPGRWVFSNFTARLDPIVYRWSGGLVNSTGPILFPVLALTTTGRKSGKKRTVQLAYVAFDGNVYLVASNFGKEHHPAWMHNMEADPNVSVQIGRNDYGLTAERLTEDEKAAVWERLVAQVPNFDAYEERSGRILRVYRLPIPGIEETL